MDPNATLRELRTAVRWEADRSGEVSWMDAADNATNMAERAEALDKWMCSGGFLPADWARKQVAYVVQRANFDGLYLFENEKQAEKYTELMARHGASYEGAVTLLDAEAAARLIEETKLDMAED